jgi:hypothetical protein
MSAAVKTPPAILSKTVAELLLDGAWDALDKALDNRADCVECKARHGWCEDCGGMDYARDAIAGAQSQVRRTASDRQAAEITVTLVQTLSGKRYGVASWSGLVSGIAASGSLVSSGTVAGGAE